MRLWILWSFVLASADAFLFSRRSLGAMGLLSLTWPVWVAAEDASISDYVQEKIHGSDVVVFAKSYCPYCRQSRQLLMNLHMEQDWTLDIIDIDLMKDGPAIQAELLQQTGQRTVPNIFIAGKHVGGNSDLQEIYHTGALEQQLADLANGSIAEEM